MTKLGRIALLSSAACGMAFPGIVFGQEAAAQDDVAPPETEQAASADTESYGIEDIVVSAQRRQEVAQDIPVSITAVSGSTLQSAAIKDLQGLTKSVIGIQLDSESIQRPELYIRGIGSNRFDIGGEPSSGTYIDEIYQPRFSNALNGLVDLDRVEVLRGPQGTLFGRNTIGGAVSVYTPAPSDEFSGYVSGSYGNKDYVAANGYLNIPLGEKVRARISGGYSDRDGFMRDTVSGKDDGLRSYTLRGKIVADLNDHTTFQVTGTYYDAKQSAVLLNPVNTLALFLAGPQAVQLPDDDRYSGAYNTPGGNHVRQKQIDGRLVIDGDSVVTTIIGAYIENSLDVVSDLDGAPNDIVLYEGAYDTKTYSLEFRLASQEGGIATFGDRFRWVMGAYLYQDKGFEFADFTLGTDSVLSFVAANPTMTPPFNPATLRYTDRSAKFNNLKSLAFYFQGTYDITDRIGLTLGGRYTYDERRFNFFATSDPIKPFPLPLTGAPFSVIGKPKASSWDPKVTLDFKPTDDVLLYASFSSGFKSGSIQSTAFNPLVGGFVAGPESVDAYEVGAKTEFFDRRLRLNVAGFINKFSDLQVRRVVTFPGGFATAVVENAADSTIKGVEVEASVIPVPGLRINGSYAYLDAKYDTYVVDAAAGIDYSGNRLPRAPKHRFNVDANYDVDFASGARLALRAEYNFSGAFYFQPSNSPEEREGSYGLANASAAFTLPNEKTTVQLWGRNIFGKEYRTYLDPLQPSLLEGWSEKATYGVTLSHKF